MGKSLWPAIVAAGLVVFGANSASAQMGFSFQVGGLFLNREAGNRVPLLTDGAPGSPVVFNEAANNLNAWGGIATLRAGGPNLGFELRGMFSRPATTSWSFRFNPASNGVSFATHDPSGWGVFNSPGDYILTADRETTFRSIEANLVHAADDNASAFFGVRAMRIGDIWSGNLVAVGFESLDNNLEIRINNQLIGPQLGVLAQGALSDIFGLSAFTRIGILRNTATGNFRTFGGLPGAENNWSATETIWTMVAEFGVDLTINLSDRLSLFAGASLLYVNNAATSTQTMGVIEANPGEGPVIGDIAFEPAIYQGLRFGLTLGF